MSQPLPESNNFEEKIISLIQTARTNLVYQANQTLVATYFEIGRMIVEEEQQGSTKAQYGKYILQNLSTRLTSRFGKSFHKRNLELMRQVHLAFAKTNTLYSQLEKNQVLSWSHYVRLSRITDDLERDFYITQSELNNWSFRQLERQVDSALYQRVALSRDKTDVLKDSLAKYHEPQEPRDIIKDPYILEFVGIEEKAKYSETDLETALIDHLEKFMLELGRGYGFIARQKRISFSEKNFYIDLVFYNYILNCFVLIDLKINEPTHGDLGQMQMYKNYYDREVKQENHAKTIGLILAPSKEDSIVEYTLPEDNTHIFASKYKLVLPSKEELQREIKKTIEIVEEKKATKNLQDDSK